MNKNIYIMIDKNQVQSAMLMNGTAFVIAKMLPETNYTPVLEVVKWIIWSEICAIIHQTNPAFCK